MDAPKRSSAVVWAAALMVMLPVLYLTGLGPVAWLESHAVDDPEMRLWECYVRPAAWLCGVVPAAKGSLDWYISLWD